jgi:3-oxoacyl-[acyl-carrier protein] reductase
MPQRPDPPADFNPEKSGEPVAQAPPQGEEATVEDLFGSMDAEPRPSSARTAATFRGRVAIITGASRGIGRAIALEFAASGAHVAFNYLDTGPESRLQANGVVAELQEFDVKVFSQACDVRRPEDVAAFVQDAVGDLGGLHFLVNNAGIGRDRALWRMTNEEWTSVLETNLAGAFYFIRAAAPFFRAQEWGKIVNVSSVHGLRGDFGLANYISSKAGLIGLTRSAALELGARNVNVNAVAPGYIRTTQLTEQVPAEILDRARDRSALGRLGDPQDVAHVVLFLCSEGARHITGAVIPIDGGYLL